MLRRVVGLPGAVIVGLGSILGTGVYVSLAIAAGIAGPAMLIALVIAAALAACNGLSSAQLAAAHPVSGGTYAYGYRFLHPVFGFTAGWMFLWAKSASAATAALGFAGYALHLFDVESTGITIALAVLGIIGITIIVLLGMRRTTTVNAVIVTITIVVLVYFVSAGLSASTTEARSNLTPFFQPSSPDTPHARFLPALLHASALLFVAYTGYGRIATLGEEVRDPRRIIPRAVIITLGITLLLYLAVAFTAIASVGAADFAATVQGAAAPLEVVAATFNVPGAGWVLAVGAITAMLGVLLNLILGLSRVILAMGRQRDMPAVTAKLNREQSTPTVAVVVMAIVVAGLCLLGDVRLTWSFSAFTVLIYYAITNAAALRLTSTQRLYPRWIAALGLLGCVGLAFWVDWPIWLAGLGLIAVGLGWHAVANAIARRA